MQRPFIENFHIEYSLKRSIFLKLISHLKSEDHVSAGKIIGILEYCNLHPKHKSNKKQEAQKAKLNRILSTQREFLGDTRQYLANLATCMFPHPSYRLSKRCRVAGHYESFQTMIHPLNLTTSNPENVFYSNGIINSVEDEDNHNKCESNEDEDSEDSSRKSDEDLDNENPLTKDFKESDLSGTDFDDSVSNYNPDSDSSISVFETGKAWEDIIQDEQSSVLDKNSMLQDQGTLKSIAPQQTSLYIPVLEKTDERLLEDDLTSEQEETMRWMHNLDSGNFEDAYQEINATQML